LKYIPRERFVFERTSALNLKFNTLISNFLEFLGLMPKQRGARAPTHSGSWYEDNRKRMPDYY